jgi:hypothetical protein
MSFKYFISIVFRLNIRSVLYRNGVVFGISQRSFQLVDLGVNLGNNMSRLLFFYYSSMVLGVNIFTHLGQSVKTCSSMSDEFDHFRQFLKEFCLDKFFSLLVLLGHFFNNLLAHVVQNFKVVLF